jgi:hypothetical protein
MRISIRHQLSVTPPPGTTNLVMQLLLTPKSGPTQDIESWSVDVQGMENAAVFYDAYGNTAHMVNQAKPEGELLVNITGVVNTRDTHGVLGRPGGEPVVALYKRMTQMTRVPVTLYGKYRGEKNSRLDILHGLMLRVSDTLMTTVQPAAPATSGQSQSQNGMSQTIGSMTQSMGGMSQTMGADGSTQGMIAEPEVPLAPPLEASESDQPPVIEEPGHEVVVRLPLPPATEYAHMFVGAARALGIPARFVTGYLVGTDDEPAKFHAWAEAYTEKLGWIGFDPMLELCPTDRHVRLAVGLDSLSAAPLRCVPAGEGVVDNGVEITLL